VQAIADKKVSVKEKRIDEAVGDTKTPKRSEISDSTRGISAGPSQRSKATFANDSMLEDSMNLRSTGLVVAR
jgi:hypothetical protein